MGEGSVSAICWAGEGQLIGDLEGSVTKQRDSMARMVGGQSEDDVIVMDQSLTAQLRKRPG